MLELKVLPAERFVLILCLLTAGSCFGVYVVKFLDRGTGEVKERKRVEV